MLNTAELELVISNLIAQATTITPNLNITEKTITLTVTATLQVSPIAPGTRATPNNSSEMGAGYDVPESGSGYKYQNPWGLTKREEEVMRLLNKKGLNITELSQELSITHHTAEAHIRSIREKMEVTDKLKAVLLWQQYEQEAR